MMLDKVRQRERERELQEGKRNCLTLVLISFKMLGFSSIFLKRVPIMQHLSPTFASSSLFFTHTSLPATDCATTHPDVQNSVRKLCPDS